MSYDLYGVSNHSGTLHGGHYTATCRHPAAKDSAAAGWSVYNDRATSGTSPTSVISYEAYLLFFERKEVNDDDEQEAESSNGGGSEVNGVEAAEDEDDGDEEW